MIALASIIDTAGDSLGEGLPRVGAALVLLLLGLVLAALIGRGLTKALRAAGLDELAERGGVHDAVERFGGGRSLSRTVGRAIRVALTVVVVLAAVSLLGFGFLQESINQGVLFLPRLLVALVLLVAGVVIGTWAKRQVDRLGFQLDLPGPVGRVVELGIFAVFTVTAMAHVGVSTPILTVLVALGLGGVVATLALAFGLGNREVARGLTAGRMVRSAFEIGQTISVAGIRGEIESFDSAATVLATPGGSRVRVPNHLLVEEVVEIDDGAAGE